MCSKNMQDFSSDILNVLFLCKNDKMFGYVVIYLLE